MQTYTRKRPEYQAIEGVKDLCRLCLEKYDEAVPIFTDDSDVCASLPMRIMICVGLEMAREECLPNVICKECYMELERYYAFRKKCVLSYQKLKSHMLAVRDTDLSNYTTEQVQKDDIQENCENRPILENGDKEEQRLILAYNEGEQLEIVDVVSLNGVIQVGDDIKDLTNPTNTSHVIKESENSHIPELATSANLPTIQMSSELDMSNLLTTLLVELGVVTRQDDRLKVMQNIKTLELEGGDGSVVTLELVEEDEELALTDKGGGTLHEMQDVNIDSANVIEVSIEPTRTENAVIHSEQHKEKKKEAGAGAGASTVCAVCSKVFSSRSVLARHSLVHSAERPHACARCGRAFTQRAVLRRHELVHQERRPFACAVCGKSYTQRGALQAHSRVHGRALALHRCPHCPKIFLYSSGLSRHMKSHEGRVFTCGACSRPFQDKSALLRHVRAAHRDHHDHRDHNVHRDHNDHRDHSDHRAA